MTPRAISTATTNNDSPSADVCPAVVSNFLQMEEVGAFDAGYDSDNSLGPERGTDPAELAALEEEALILNALVLDACNDDDEYQRQPMFQLQTQK
jgi:hypothetical protein